MRGKVLFIIVTLIALFVGSTNVANAKDRYDNRMSGTFNITKGIYSEEYFKASGDWATVTLTNMEVFQGNWVGSGDQIYVECNGQKAKMSRKYGGSHTFGNLKKGNRYKIKIWKATDGVRVKGKYIIQY